MRASQLFLPTLREVPADAELASHRLLVRGGFVRRLSAGVYSYLPLGWRVHEKIAAIVREEMNAIGGQEVHLPVLVPKELMDETGRSALDVLFPLRDRSHRDYFLGFTHEEVVTDIVRGDVRSWRQLPLLLYQIQTKFRDEPRPRGGLVRAREFTMKDGYSFDLDEAGLDKVYRAHFQAYRRIFSRCGVQALAVAADAGAIGGSENHEFMALTDAGEDTVLRCDRCGYAANTERADIGPECLGKASDLNTSQHATPTPLSPGLVSTPDAHTVAQVCDYLGVGPERIIKTILVMVDGKPLAALVRGDRELNLSKLARCVGAEAVAMADAGTVERVTGAPVGFAGPVGLQGPTIVADHELKGAVGMVVGANEIDAHRAGVAPEADFPVHAWADIRTAVAGDPCPQPGCPGRYAEARGIEMGHIFKLGVKYSRALGAQAQGEDGTVRDILMGCYGLGVSRLMAAVVEANHDNDGIAWPIEIAPFGTLVMAVNPNDDAQRAAAEAAYASLRARGVDALLDDRDERSGVKFKDADLVGYPVRVVAGRAVAQGAVEVIRRGDRASAGIVPLDEIGERVADLLEMTRSSSHITP